MRIYPDCDLESDPSRKMRQMYTGNGASDHETSLHDALRKGNER